ncbi:YggU family protein [Candidatus Woesearchaeota archaeon]|nr:YggU family protein [Candidatus Woesearchaeota archaeon]
MEFPSKFKIIVKANSKKNEVIGYDELKKGYNVRIKAKAEDNKANKEIIKFLSKTSGKKVRIVSGLRSKEKLIEIK